MGDQRHHEHKPRAWTLAEHAKLVALSKAGHTIKSIGLELNRPGSSVSGRLKSTDDNGQFVSRPNRPRLSDMGVENPDRKHRTCICCRKTFASESWDHRRCSQCKRNLHRSEVHSDEYSIHV